MVYYNPVVWLIWVSVLVLLCFLLFETGSLYSAVWTQAQSNSPALTSGELRLQVNAATPS